MKTIYLNSNFECSTVKKADTVQSVQTAIFDGKCNKYIEGFRYIPKGQTWTRGDGVQFTGEMVAPFKDFTYLEMAQSIYDELTNEVINGGAHGTLT